MASITPRTNKNGEVTSYTIRVYRGYDCYGKRLKPHSISWKPNPNMTVKQNERELLRIASEFEEQCISGFAGNAEKITLNEFCRIYLDAKEKTLSPSTFDFYKRTIDSKIIPALGHHKISQIKPMHVQAFVNQLCSVSKQKRNGEKTEELLKVASIKRYLTILQSIFRFAIKQNIIRDNPAKSELLEIPRIITPKIDIFTKQEAAIMLECLENEDLQFQTFIQLAIMTGARRGELTALKFSDFDFNRNKVTIERAAIKVKGKPTQIKSPKDYEIRTVAVNQLCMELIKLLREENNKSAEKFGSAWHEHDWLFTQWNGEIMNPQTPTKQFAKFLEKNGLKHRKLHSLRHTSATLLLYGGVNIKQVQERLGHADLTTTNKYLHYISEADEQAANVLQDMLIIKRDNKERIQA